MTEEKIPETPATTAPPVRRPFAGAPGGPRRRMGFVPRRKVCRFCADRVQVIDHKQIHMLRTFITEAGKILAGRVTGNCAKHQRQLTRSIKRARNLSVLPYVGI